MSIPTDWADEVATHQDAELVFQSASPADLFMLLFTSGTSGDPKAVMVSHGKVAVGRPGDDAAVQPGPRRCLLRVDAVVPFQRGTGRLGGGGGVPGLIGVAAQVLCVGILAGRAPLRRHLRQLRGQAVVLCARHARAARRRGQPAARGVRQRGRTARRRAVRPQVRLSTCRTVSGRPNSEWPSRVPPKLRPARWGHYPKESGSSTPTPVSRARRASLANW